MPGSAHRAALPTQKLDSGNSEGVGPPGARPFDSDPCAEVCRRTRAAMS
jgi:hypothetical protein